MRPPPIHASLEPQAYRRLIEACMNALPDEACGVLSGSFIVVDQEDSRGDAASIAAESLMIAGVHPVRNTAANPASRFAFDPADWVRVLYDMQRNRQSLVGFYHSHPASLPVPSPADREGLPGQNAGTSYWIVAPHHPTRGTIVQPYWLQDETFSPLMLAQISI
ncbi:M67 family metallopeptidase [Paenibacillus rhizovicinus]|uniref:M67 family metallopeptidase n=1 Tax=Paenibacillus rhizovicinus TaxID=2704463 RepID=A0A6C0PC11_9BACL|nr:M67 family metallopeptidase [Paenibacillus rhizovicinus]QHW34232.1 M67 family metallopeptidase [Paenibacillus rhizovicinus]